MQPCSVERKTERPIHGREKRFRIAYDEEREDLRTRAASERVLQRAHADADDFRPAGLRIPGFTQEVDEGVNPFVLGRIEAHRVNTTPMALIERAWRRPRRPFRHDTHIKTSCVMLRATEADSRRKIADVL